MRLATSVKQLLRELRGTSVPGRHEHPERPAIDSTPGATHRPRLCFTTGRPQSAGSPSRKTGGGRGTSWTVLRQFTLSRFFPIIGDVCGTGAKGTDEVVPVASAHLDGIDSEIVIPASHTTVHHHPRAVLEVRRILMEHLQAVPGRNNGLSSATADGQAGTLRGQPGRGVPTVALLP